MRGHLNVKLLNCVCYIIIYLLRRNFFQTFQTHSESHGLYKVC